MNEVFNKYIVMKKLFVLLKLVIMLDGKIVIVFFYSKWIMFEEVCLDVY